MNFKINREDLFNHPHNKTLKNERAVELPLAFRYIELVGSSNLIELGAVTPYYKEIQYDVIDLLDKKATIHKDISEVVVLEKDVLSISTIEHVGRGDYGLKKNTNLAIEQLFRIHSECKSCLITWPIGYNKPLDNAVKENIKAFDYWFYTKTNKPKLNWPRSKELKCFASTYDPGRCVICIFKGIGDDDGSM